MADGAIDGFGAGTECKVIVIRPHLWRQLARQQQGQLTVRLKAKRLGGIVLFHPHAGAALRATPVVAHAAIVPAHTIVANDRPGVVQPAQAVAQIMEVGAEQGGEGLGGCVVACCVTVGTGFMACIRRMATVVAAGTVVATATIAAMAEQLGKRIGDVLDCIGIQLCRKCLGRLLAFDGPGHFLRFGFFVVQAHEHGGITDVVGSLFVLFDQNFQIAQIAPNSLIIRLGIKVADHGRAGLAIAVHTAVALLKNHQRPGNVEVNQPVCLIVQVEALGGHIRCNEQPQR